MRIGRHEILYTGTNNSSSSHSTQSVFKLMIVKTYENGTPSFENVPKDVQVLMINLSDSSCSLL